MLRSGTLKCFGYFTLCTAAALIVLVFLVPYLILQKIMGGLQQTYQLGESNTKIWSKMPGERNVKYQKSIVLYNVSSESYYQINQIKLIPAFNFSVDKKTEFVDLKFSDERVEATMKQSYIVPAEFKAQDILSQPLLQFRHGALRAISEIEHRHPT